MNELERMRSLAGRVVVITGAASGIGLAAARLIAGDGGRVVLVDRDADALARLATEIGDASRVVVGDVSEEPTSIEFVNAAMQWVGRIDGLMLNAGTVGPVTGLDRIRAEEFDRTYAVNVRGSWLGMKEAFPIMKRQGGGSIVLTSSVGGMRGAARAAAYGASKHAVVGLMMAGALEGASRGIRVNAVVPGPTDTAMMNALSLGLNPEDPEAARRMTIERVPMRRLGLDAEVAAVAAFLLSDAAAFCTGSVYPVDGGQTAGF